MRMPASTVGATCEIAARRARKRCLSLFGSGFSPWMSIRSSRTRMSPLITVLVAHPSFCSSVVTSSLDTDDRADSRCSLARSALSSSNCAAVIAPLPFNISRSRASTVGAAATGIATDNMSPPQRLRTKLRTNVSSVIGADRRWWPSRGFVRGLCNVFVTPSSSVSRLRRAHEEAGTVPWLRFVNLATLELRRRRQQLNGHPRPGQHLRYSACAVLGVGQPLSLRSSAATGVEERGKLRPRARAS